MSQVKAREFLHDAMDRFEASGVGLAAGGLVISCAAWPRSAGSPTARKMPPRRS